MPLPSSAKMTAYSAALAPRVSRLNSLKSMRAAPGGLDGSPALRRSIAPSSPQIKPASGRLIPNAGLTCPLRHQAT
jgi:hypothetical protein